MIDPPRLDLNLLTVFEALMRRRSVTGAAELLGLGQPATSAALKRLRAMCGDPLFVRGRAGLDPTPRALELEPVVVQALDALRTAISAAPGFDPATAKRAFRISASDFLAVIVLPDLSRRIATEAPGVRFVVAHVAKERVAEALESGRIDVALGHFPDLEGALKVRGLFTDELVCLFDAEACGTEPPLSLEDYQRLPHLLMSSGGQLSGVVDEALAAIGRDRRVLIGLPYFLALPFFLLGMPAVACVPRRLADRCANATRLSVSPPPVPMPGLDVRIAWAERADADAGIIWLRGAIVQAVSQRATD